jgi:hypothetical protein
VLKPRYLPDVDRLSVLAATILLAYVLARWVNIPLRDFSLQLPGFFFAFQLNVRTLVVLLVAGLTASGADWLLRDHPGLVNKNTVEHWLLPALTAWVIGFPLFQLQFGVLWLLVFLSGGILLTLVLVAEYIVVDPGDVRHPAASAGLTAVSFALFLTLVVVLRLSHVRLYVMLLAVTLAVGLVSLRTLHLRLHGQWKVIEAIVVDLIVVQIAAALHYWPLTPVPFGMALLGPAYAVTSLISNLEEGELFPQALLEPGLVMAFVLVVVLWYR